MYYVTNMKTGEQRPYRLIGNAKLFCTRNPGWEFGKLEVVREPIETPRLVAEVEAEAKETPKRRRGRPRKDASEEQTTTDPGVDGGIDAE